MVDERAVPRRIGKPRDAGDPADDDAVIAAVVNGGGPAFKHGQRLVEDRRAGDRAGVMGHLVQLPAKRAAPCGQPARGLLRVLVQD